MFMFSLFTVICTLRIYLIRTLWVILHLGGSCTVSSMHYSRWLFSYCVIKFLVSVNSVLVLIKVYRNYNCTANFEQLICRYLCLSTCLSFTMVKYCKLYMPASSMPIGQILCSQLIQPTDDKSSSVHVLRLFPLQRALCKRVDKKPYKRSVYKLRSKHISVDFQKVLRIFWREPSLDLFTLFFLALYVFGRLS